MWSKRHRQGFTLVEITVVLVIIGAIVGVVLSMKSIIRNSQLQSITTDTARYINAVMDFQKKYDSLPGDMATATSYWGTNPNCAANAPGATPQLTCNGNGDGLIFNFNASTATPAINMTERYLVWQHLANAGFITGSYTGVTGSSTYVTVDNTIKGPLKNIPASSISGAGYDLYYMGDQTSTSFYGGGGDIFFNGSYGHVLVLGGTLVAGDSLTVAGPSSPVLSVAEAAAIDLKIDDGIPSSGHVLTPADGVQLYCSTAPGGFCGSTATPAYCPNTVKTTALACSLIFITGF